MAEHDGDRPGVLETIETHKCEWLDQACSGPDRAIFSLGARERDDRYALGYALPLDFMLLQAMWRRPLNISKTITKQFAPSEILGVFIMALVPVHSPPTRAPSMTQGDPGRFERLVGDRKDGARPRNQLPHKNIWNCKNKICFMRSRDDGVPGVIFSKSDYMVDSVTRSAYDFAGAAMNATRGAIDFFNPYSGAATLGYLTTQTSALHNWTDVSPLGLPNLPSGGSQECPGSCIPVQAAVLGGIALFAVPVFLGGRWLYQYFTQQPSPQAAPTPEVVPLQAIPVTPA
ncbi:MULTISPECIES: hypothetical protein [unclassified Acidisoma]|jgi:hypothetical protein|uniref:hypothetical protein n=1 Tax=unclassified Acidisoma TaxID=2634065 RepID=UPI00131D928C|nr:MULTISPECIES: hypothetical protein [unclassified Acidisoma]